MSPHLDNVLHNSIQGSERITDNRWNHKQNSFKSFIEITNDVSMNNKMLTDSYGTMVNNVSLMK